MRAGAHRRRTHESRQCVARCISCNITSWRAAKNKRAESPAHTRPPRGRSERLSSGARRKVALRQAYCLAQDLGSLPQRQARPPQPVVREGWERPPHKHLIIQGQLSPGDFRRPRHPGQCPGPPDQVLDEVLGPPPARRDPRPEPWLVADGVPRQGADKVVPGVGVAGPRTRLVREEGVPVARLAPPAGRKGGTGTRPGLGVLWPNDHPSVPRGNGRGHNTQRCFDPPPAKKRGYPGAGGYGCQKPKNHWGIIVSPKMMMLQGVRRQKPYIGVCYAHDPQRGGGYTTLAPALDLTTSLRK